MLHGLSVIQTTLLKLYPLKEANTKNQLSYSHKPLGKVTLHYPHWMPLLDSFKTLISSADSLCNKVPWTPNIQKWNLFCHIKIKKNLNRAVEYNLLTTTPLMLSFPSLFLVNSSSPHPAETIQSWLTMVLPFHRFIYLLWFSLVFWYVLATGTAMLQILFKMSIIYDASLCRVRCRHATLQLLLVVVYTDVVRLLFFSTKVNMLLIIVANPDAFPQSSSSAEGKQNFPSAQAAKSIAEKLDVPISYNFCHYFVCTLLALVWEKAQRCGREVSLSAPVGQWPLHYQWSVTQLTCPMAASALLV